MRGEQVAPISEKYRRGIVLPLSVTAEEEVRNFSVSEKTEVEILELLDDEFFFKYSIF